MADSLHVGDNKKELKRTMICSTSQTKNHIVASIPKYCSMKSLRRIVNVEQGILGMGTISEVGLFLLKTAILEAVRRFSKAHCPFLWQSLQALQFVCLPPFKWIQKWGLFRGLVKGMQVGPLLYKAYVHLVQLSYILHGLSFVLCTK